MEELNVKERLEQFVLFKGINVSQFEKRIGVGNKSFRSTQNPSANTLVKIFAAFPELSAEWVMRGEGEMIKTKETKETQVIYNNYQRGEGDGQTNVIGDHAMVSDRDALRMALEQNAQLINALLNKV